MNEHVAVIALAKNEIEALRQTSKTLRKALSRLDCETSEIYVDGNSTDGSYEFLRSNNFHVIQQSAPGIPCALIEGLSEAKRLGASIAVMFQPDGNCDADKIPELVTPIIENHADLVIASRYFHGIRSEDDTILSSTGNLLFRWMFRLRFRGSRLTDPIVGFRAFKMELIDQLEVLELGPYRHLERLLRTTLSFDPLMTTRALSSGLRVLEVDAPEPPRIGGEEKKTSWRWGIAYSCQLWFDRLIWK